MKALLRNKQLVYLFLCNFAILFIGFGLFPLLPIYAAEFNASPAFTGIYLAITYIAISIGSILAGQLSERLPRKALFISAGLLGTPALYLLGQAQSLWQVVLFTALVWFAGGIGLSISNVLTSLHTSASMRGKAFGLISLASPLGALVGGLTVGWLVEWSGYQLMFSFLAIVWAMYPFLAMTKIQDVPACVTSGQTPLSKPSSQRPGLSFLLLLVTVLLASMTVSVGRMGLSLSMKAQQFSASDISTANAFGGLVTIAVTLLIGVLSDKLGRRYFLLSGYVVAMGSTLLLIYAREAWQFWIVSSAVLCARSIVTSMSPAYATDLLSRKALGKSLPLIGTMNWLSSAIGFASSGYVQDFIGVRGLYLSATVAAIVAVSILVSLPSSRIVRTIAQVTGASETLSPTGD